FTANQSLLWGSTVAPQELSGVASSGFGQSQQGDRRSGVGGFGAQTAFGNRLNSAVRPSGGIAGGAGPVARGLVDDDFGAAPAGGRGDTIRVMNGRIDVQLPATTSEEQLNRQ